MGKVGDWSAPFLSGPLRPLGTTPTLLLGRPKEVRLLIEGYKAECRGCGIGKGSFDSPDPEVWSTHLEGLSDSDEDTMGVAVIAQDEVSMALGQ